MIKNLNIDYNNFPKYLFFYVGELEVVIMKNKDKGFIGAVGCGNDVITTVTYTDELEKQIEEIIDNW